ncbi:MAG: baseplate J/gp47 family protein [Bacteroidota bacterium]
MSFTPKTYNELYEQMRQRSSVVTDFEVGSVARTMFETFSYELALLYEKLNLVYLAGFVDTAEGQQLDNVVAILGIKRGLPDFAEGLVTFQRDIGNEDIPIPLGTLVATEDTPDSPKKVYLTIEERVLPKDQTLMDIKVRAVNRGEDEDTGANTVVVMPRPVPGIKDVNNSDPIRLTGKRRESDDALRERAKNALISSGKATILSIENALISLPGVKDVKVKENFHFARGFMTFTRNAGAGDVNIPRSAEIVGVGPSMEEKPFVTREAVILPDGDASVEVPVVAMLEGKLGEVSDTTGYTWTISDAGLSDLGASVAAPLILEQFGVIEVFVDGPDLSQPEENDRILTAIDEVRAAGIFVILKGVEQVEAEAIFRISLNPVLSLSDEERAEFEETVRQTILNLMANLKMGDKFFFAQIIKEVLSLDGLENLDDFQIETTKSKNGITYVNQYGFADKLIELEEFERFDLEDSFVCVASEDKELVVDLEFQATGLDVITLETLITNFTAYFNGLSLGAAVRQDEIEAIINDPPLALTLDAASFKMEATAWCERPLLGVDSGVNIVQTSFVEQPVLGNVFAYHSVLDISGVLQLTLPPSITNDERNALFDAIRTGVSEYLDALPQEADVEFTSLIEIAAGVDRVLAVEIDENDFEAAIGATVQAGRVSATTIAVEPFEKARLATLNFTF